MHKRSNKINKILQETFKNILTDSVIIKTFVRHQNRLINVSIIASPDFIACAIKHIHATYHSIYTRDLYVNK